MFYIDTEEWLEARSHGIGGSEASIVMGINPWKSRLQLWNEKVTKTRQLDPDAQMSLKLGNYLEPLIAEEYSKITGRKLEIQPQKIHPRYPFILGNIDREIIKDPKGSGILEIKTKGAWTDWHGDDIPPYYNAQLQQYLEIYGYKWGSFAVLDLGTLKISCIDIERDDNLISNIIDEEKKFWKLVEDKIPPPVDASESCTKFLKEYYKESEDIVVDLIGNEDVSKWINILKSAKDIIKQHEAVELEAKNHLMSIMGNAQKAIGNGFSINWRSPKDKEVFNLERFKIDHSDIYNKYMTKEPQSRRFTVRFSDSDKENEKGKTKEKVQRKDVDKNKK